MRGLRFSNTGTIFRATGARRKIHLTRTNSDAKDLGHSPPRIYVAERRGYDRERPRNQQAHPQECFRSKGHRISATRPSSGFPDLHRKRSLGQKDGSRKARCRIPDHGARGYICETRLGPGRALLSGRACGWRQARWDLSAH